ncbi:hypothetical protein KZP23_04935 [Echinicola marina]|uniref:hypothetical protein n=1 Tax=Echinicola marina TaxID=2859768 RepID=UPI001CF6ED51|nr:hypothetical protein [Echinicola marina]UCS94375.1 hypothetical protein KZP23_04935 [Echinicola marina]
MYFLYFFYQGSFLEDSIILRSFLRRISSKIFSKYLFLPSLIFHSAWYFGVKEFGFYVDLNILTNLLSNSPNPSSIENIEQHAVKVFFYNFSMLLMAAASGHYFQKLVRVRKWDRKFKQLRFQNSWHYILKGEFFDFPRSAFDLEVDTVERIEIVYVDAVVKIEEGSIIYDGILVDYELSKDGGLETISLKEVHRRYLKDDKTQASFDHKYYEIPGHILILKYSEIINLNFSYYKVIEENGSYNIELVK